MKFNANQYIKAKLTELGKQRYSDYCTEYYDFFAKLFPLEEDERGYSKWQLWHFMEIFGGKNTGIGKPNLYELDIIFCDEE